MLSSAHSQKPPVVLAQGQRTSGSVLSRLSNWIVELNPWVLTAVFIVFVFVCNAGLDWYMLKHHESTLSTVEVSDVLSALIAGLLFLKIAQYRRARRLALRQRLEIIGDMNHHIRNALEVISLSAYTSKDQQNVQQIRESVDRITWALKEILPKI